MKVRICIYIIALTLLFSDCKKFPEDPFISLRTVRMRMQGEWMINKIQINGNDFTESYNDSLMNQQIPDFKVEITKSHNESDFIGILKSHRTTTFDNQIDVEKKVVYFRKWTFNSGLVEKPDSTNLRVFNNLIRGQFEIRKLYKKDFIIKRSNDNGTCEIHFRK